MVEKKRYWTGPLPKLCDTCSGPITKWFVDGATVFGPWAIMCHCCVDRGMSRGLGTGRGQKYDAKTGKKIGG